MGSMMLFIHVPKTAGTSIRRTLNMKHGKQGKHTPAEQYRRLLGQEYDKANTFAVVRNPLEWLWSFYRFLKWSDINPDTGKPWRHEIHPLVAPLDFPGFVNFVCTENGFSRMSDGRKLKRLGFPKLTQSAFVSNPEGKVIVKTLFQHENIGTTLPRWLASHGIQIGELVTTNVSRRLQTTTETAYTEPMKKLVENRFAEDFTLWESAR